MPATPLDLLASEFGAVAGRLERETRLRIEAAISDTLRREAERELRFAKLERMIEDRISSMKDGDPGKSISAEDVKPLVVDEVDRRFSKIPLPKDGKDAEPVSDERMAMAIVAYMANNPTPKGDVGEPGLPGKDAEPVTDAQIAEGVAQYLLANPPQPGKPGESIKGDVGEPGLPGKDAEPAAIAELVSRAVAAIPTPKDGKDADPEFVKVTVATAVRDAVAAIPPAPKGDPGPMGSLPAVKQWEDRVHYLGDVVLHSGSTHQAVRDTAKEPPHDDWRCLAASGKDGADGRSFTIRGTFDAGATHKNLDVVALNGASFVAKRDNPGPCPGDGWQLVAKQGGVGKPGETGRPGKVERGSKVESLSISDEGLLTLRHEDGSTVTCDLYPLLAQIA